MKKMIKMIEYKGYQQYNLNYSCGVVTSSSPNEEHCWSKVLSIKEWLQILGEHPEFLDGIYSCHHHDGR